MYAVLLAIGLVGALEGLSSSFPKSGGEDAERFKAGFGEEPPLGTTEHFPGKRGGSANRFMAASVWVVASVN